MSECSNGFCAIFDVIAAWYGGVIKIFGIEHVDISFNGHKVYIGRGGGVGRNKMPEANSDYVYQRLSQRSDGTLGFGNKKGCSCKNVSADDIVSCLKNRGHSEGRNCQGDVKDAVNDCCLTGFSTIIADYFGGW